MKNIVRLSIFAFLLMAITSLRAQDSTILPAQAEAIRQLAAEKGFSPQQLEEYVRQKIAVSLEKLSRRNAAVLIAAFQSASPPSPSDTHQNETVRSIPASAMPGKSSGGSVLLLSKAQSDLKTPLLLAEFLEPGMTKRFHLVDGNIIQGTILRIDSNICFIETSDGILKIPPTDILEETAEITKRDGSRYVGPVLKESMEDITIRSKYGDIAIGKREIQDMNRFHGGKLVPWAEERKTFYRSEVVLTDIFFDPTAFPLDPNTLYISALSLGYGFTENFMVRTSFGNNFTGDLNLQPIYQFYSKRTGTNKIAAAIGVDMYSHHDMTSIIVNYAPYIRKKTSGKNLNDIPNADAGSVLTASYKKTFYSEIYCVYSHRWSLESGRGEMGYHVGFRTNTLPLIRSAILDTAYAWSNETIAKIPFRFWAAFEYDLTKDLKLAANIWMDNGYRYRTLDQTLKDYFTETPFLLDGLSGEYRTVDFDFGLLYAVNNSLRLGIHFQHPYLQLFWRILEF